MTTKDTQEQGSHTRDRNRSQPLGGTHEESNGQVYDFPESEGRWRRGGRLWWACDDCCGACAVWLWPSVGRRGGMDLYGKGLRTTGV